MISGALVVCLLVGFTVGLPSRRQNGYEYDVKHPGGNSRVHVRAGGEGHRNSHPGEYISEATYINPHYVEPHYQPNSYGHYPVRYNDAPSHGYIGQKVPVYEERSRYPKPAYQQSYAIHPHAQEISQSNIDAGPFYDKPAAPPLYSSPKFVQQAAVEDLELSHPPSKIEQVHLDPKPTYDELPIVQKVEQIASEPAVVEQLSDLHEPQLPLKEDSPVIVPNPPLDQQVLVDEPEPVAVVSQEPVLVQVTEDVPPPKVIVTEPEPPVVQQSSLDVPPPSSGVQYMEDDVQLPLDPKPSVKTVVQQAAEEDTFHSAPPKYEFVPFGPPYERISHSTEIIHGPPRNAYPPPQQEHVDVPLSVKLPPPVTQSVVPHAQEIEEVPFVEPHQSVKLPPPALQSVKLPPPPPITKSLPSSPYGKEPVFSQYPPRPHSVKLPPPSYTSPPQYKPVAGVKAPPPYFKRPAPSYSSHSVKQPFARSYYVKSPRVSQPPLSYVPVAKSPVPYSVKRPYLPPPPVSSYPSSYNGNPYVKAPYYKTPVVKSPPISYGVKQPVVVNTHPVKHPQPVGSVKGYPSIKSPSLPLAQSSYGEEPHLDSPPVSPSVKHPQPVAAVKGYPSVKSPPLTQSSYGDEPLLESPPVLSSVKHPQPVAAVKGYPSVKSPPLTQSSYGNEPLLESPPVLSSVKHPQPVAAVKGYPSVKSPPLTQSSYGDEPLLESPPVLSSVKHPQPVAEIKGYPNVKSPPLAQSSYGDEPPSVSSSLKHPPVDPSHLKHPPQTSGPVKKYLPVGHAFDTSGPEPNDELGLNAPSEVLHPLEESSPLEKYPPVSHAFQISPPAPKPESSHSVGDKVPEPSPLDKYRQVSHSVRLPVSKPPATPNLFAAVPTPEEVEDAKASLESPPPVSHSVLLPISVSDPKPSSLRSDVLSSPVSRPIRRHRGRFEEPKQDFPAFPVESAYTYPDPVSDRVAHSLGSRYEPDRSESSDSPSVEDAKLQIDRVNKDIGRSFGDRIPRL